MELPVAGLALARQALGVVGYALFDRLLYHFLAHICVGLFSYWAAIRVPQLWSSHKVGDLSYGVYLYHF